jgi:hypothetical protein
MFLDCICGSTTGGLGLLGLYINENNVALINQTLETLTEYCQGPCHDNQNCIATHESNGLDIITALILNDINPLGKTRMDLVLELKNNASKLLLAIMESRGDSENAERILYNMNPKQLVSDGPLRKTLFPLWMRALNNKLRAFNTGIIGLASQKFNLKCCCTKIYLKNATS